jgi:V8-like Glu-specific endopeptidase
MGARGGASYSGRMTRIPPRPRAALALIPVLLLASAGAAQAAPVELAKKSPAEVAAYWTKDKMRGAIPRQVVRGGPSGTAKPGGSGGGTSWTRLAVPTVEGAYAGENRNSGKVFFTMSGVNYVCSGTSVAASTGLSLVWTAGHCVHEGPGSYATNFMFAPAYLNGTTPYGKWAATALQTTDGWASSGDFTYDVGAARVVPGAGAPPNTTLRDIEIPRSMAFGYPVTVNSTRFTSYGYPAAGKFNGQVMYQCESPVVRRDGSTASAPMGIGCDMTGGSSGGGWIDSAGAVASVNSYIYYSLKNVMHGPYQGGVAWSLYDSMDG